MCYNKMYAHLAPAVGMIAVSRMGHDRGRLYAVVEVRDADFVLCADGRIRTLANPKKKRFKHLGILDVRAELGQALVAGAETDREIYALLKEISLRIRPEANGAGPRDGKVNAESGLYKGAEQKQSDPSPTDGE